ncbi:hypothetical protein RF55_18806 [Lasius niger]|uniref:Uncharacterized protein n=1 Tax=Lasius niger TaxID=67767 RepID=A0A0J7MTT6_LASNI|nr:hypothetical protein RF55_18806 [Lasius niger]
MGSGCDRNNVEESSIAETQESSGSDITDEVSDGSSREDSSDPEYKSDSSEPSDVCEAIDVEDLRALRDDNEERNAYILRELKKWAMRGVSCKKIYALFKVLQMVFPTLPRSYRILLKTSRTINLMDMENGKF